MCLIALAHRVHAQYPLVLVANRDEFYRRPTAPADWWQTSPGVLAGRDLEAGGTWLGVTEQGRWAAVTNYREGEQAAAPLSRGELPRRFLQTTESPQQFVTQAAGEGDRYRGFNLLVGDGESLFYGSNRGVGAQRLAPGVHVLSNHLLNTPWPKSEQARFKLEYQLRSPQLALEDLFSVLADRTPYDDHHLPQTGISPVLERLLSAPFIVSEDYGTRSSTVLLMAADGEVTFAEQNYVRGEKDGNLRLFRFETRIDS